MNKILNTQRLVLKPLNTDYLYSTHAYSGNTDNTKYMLFLPNNTIDETMAFLANSAAEWKKENPNFFEFAILLQNKHIGAVSLYLENFATEGELGWIIHSDYWRNGYAVEAAAAVKEFAIQDLKVKKLFAHCDSQNIASAKVMEKLGLTLEKDDGIRKNKGATEPSKEFKYSLSLS